MVSGPSGVGKGTIISHLFERRDDVTLVASWTTRPPRPGEVDGLHYRFVTEEMFDQAVDDNAFIEWVRARRACYGTPARSVSDAVTNNKTVLLELDVAGARAVKDRFPESLRIFIAPPSNEELESRLRGRGTDSPEQIQIRLADVANELAAAGEPDLFHHIIVNHDSSAAADEVSDIIGSWRQ